MLQIEFGDPFDPDKMLPLSIDKFRAERYGMLGDALSFNPSRRFPNLDKVLPLPPAKLPPWDGKRDSLINAAKGVSLPPPAPKPSVAAQYKGRHFVAAEFNLRSTSIKTTALHAPAPGYWQPTANRQDAAIRSLLEAIPPGLYLMGEPFENIHNPGDVGRLLTNIVWERWDVIRRNHTDVNPLAASALTRVVPRPEPFVSCAKAFCPATGIWQPWVHPDHALSSIVNQYWRQVWLTEGQAFPQADKDWPLDRPLPEVTWHLMDVGSGCIGQS